MIPSGIARGPRGRGGFSLPMMIAAGVSAVLLLMIVWVMLTMNTQPVTEAVSADVPVTLN